MPLSRRTTYTPNTLIDADIHNLEHDDYVAGINQAVKNTGDELIAGNKGFSSVPYTTGGDPVNDNSLVRKAYVSGVTRYFQQIAPPVYLTNATFSVAAFAVANAQQDGTLSKTTPTTVDISSVGLNGVAQSANLTGSVAVSNGSATVTGTGTTFQTDFQVGDVIAVSGSQTRRISAIASNTSLTVESNFTTAVSGANYQRGGEAPNTWYFLYTITDGQTPGLILTPRNLAAGHTLVDLPTGYTRWRQVPFAIRNNASPNIVPFFCPVIGLVLYDVALTYWSGASFVAGTNQVLSNGSAGSVTPISLANFVPPISRCAMLHADCGTSSTFALYTTGDSVVKAALGNNGGAHTQNLYFFKTNASQSIDYNRLSGANGLYLDVFGYQVTEVF
jgi:hypothetical protein